VVDAGFDDFGLRILELEDRGCAMWDMGCDI